MKEGSKKKNPLTKNKWWKKVVKNVKGVYRNLG
jgi:hypothetical protein